jgi:hypothetical protein
MSVLALGLPGRASAESQTTETKTEQALSGANALNGRAYFYGREYFVLRSGRAKIIFQIDRADLGPAFTYMLFDAEDAAQSTHKVRAFNFVKEEGFAASALRLELGGFAYTAFGEQAETRLVEAEGVPAIECVWWAGGVRVTERFFALRDAEAMVRTVSLDGCGLAGDETVSARIFLPHGRFERDGRILFQSGAEYNCALAINGDAKVQVDEEKGSIEVGPLTVGPKSKATFEAIHFFAIPGSGVDEFRARVNAMFTAGARKERERTRVAWETASSIRTDDKTVQELYDKARFGLDGMIAEDGTMDAGIFEYGTQWVRDTSNSALGALHAGHFELAHGALTRVLTKMLSGEGATLVAGGFDSPDREEFDQMGELLHALKSYRDWTGDDSLLRENRAQLLAVIERNLLPRFRDETGMVHNRREYWERTFDDAYELAYQTHLVVGLRDAAELAGALGAEERVERWRHEADRTLDSMLHHPTRALIEDGHLIKRRNVTGEVAWMTPRGLGEQASVPAYAERSNSLNPDASLALPIALGLVDARGPVALKTLDELEQLWNMRWMGGGYERYNSSSEPDTPGPWPFASCFIQRAQHDAGLFERSRRVLEWLNTVQGGRTGFWFEQIPLLHAERECGIIPWTSGEVALFVVRHLLGVRFEGAQVVLKPTPYPESKALSANLRFRSGRLKIEIEGWGRIKKAYADGKKCAVRPDGSIALPEGFAGGTLRVEMQAV